MQKRRAHATAMLQEGRSNWLVGSMLIAAYASIVTQLLHWILEDFNHFNLLLRPDVVVLPETQWQSIKLKAFRRWHLYLQRHKCKQASGISRSVSDNTWTRNIKAWIEAFKVLQLPSWKSHNSATTNLGENIFRQGRESLPLLMT